MKKLLLVLFSVLILVCSAVNVFASESEPVSAVEEGTVEDLDIEFNPSNFVDNLGKMAIGMIGIFIVIGIVILLTYMLNKVTGKKN